MQISRYIKPLSRCCFILLFWSLLVSPLHGAQFEEEVSTQEYLFAKGIIRSVSSEDRTLALKQKEGPAIILSIDNNTVFEGFYKLDELKIRQKLKVWYQPKGQDNRALKILKPLELGC
jgi:hypothetical protein